MKKKLKNLFFLTVLIACLQSMFLEYITTDYAHSLLSIYFFIELLSSLITYFFYRKKWFWLFLLVSLTLEVLVFIERDLPLSPDEIFMVLILFIRLYIIYKLGRLVNWKLNYSNE